MLISTWPSALSRVKPLSGGEVRQLLAQKVAHGRGAKGRREFVRRGDAKFGDARLDVLEGAIDKLDIAFGLLAEHDTEIAGRNKVLLDGLPIQVQMVVPQPNRMTTMSVTPIAHKCRPEWNPPLAGTDMSDPDCICWHSATAHKRAVATACDLGG